MKLRYSLAFVLVLACARAAADPGPDSEPSPATGLARWLNPATAPFIPVPEIDLDPYSGTTLGVIGVLLLTNEDHEIRKIVAPDIIHNPNFGSGIRGRIFAYPSDNTQWSIVGGAKERIESEFDAEYAAGLLRQDPWSFSASAVYDRSGSPRFFGVGNNTPLSDQTNYIYEQRFVAMTLGRNFNPQWQLGYTAKARSVDILPGRLPGIVSIQELFPTVVVRAERREILNRLFVAYDTRDDRNVPTRGTRWLLYVGAASSAHLVQGDLYSEAGIDGRYLLPLGSNSTLVMHTALRYMPHTAHTRDIPFWALSSIGGDRSIDGGEQPLRGFGAARFCDRNSFSASLEYRRRITSFDAFSTRVALELAPFVDSGRVFSSAGANPLSRLHVVEGAGIRAIASPFVVGYLDVGHGSEGTVVFTGINYPF